MEGARHIQSNGVVSGKVISLELQDICDQQFPVLCGHPNEAGVETIGLVWMGDGNEPQHFNGRLEEHLAGKEQVARENFAGLEEGIHYYADAAAAQVYGFFGELTFSVVRLRLKDNGQRDVDAIVFPAVLSIGLMNMDIGGHDEKYSKDRDGWSADDVNGDTKLANERGILHD